MNKSSVFQQIIVCILTTILVTLIVFYGYRPVSYDLDIGSVSNRDIFAQRSFIDTYQTEYEAALAKNSVSSIFIRSEDLSQHSIDNVNLFFNIIAEARNQHLDEFGLPVDNWGNIVSTMTVLLRQEFSNCPSDSSIDTFLNMSSSAFSLIHDRAVSMTELIVMDNLNTDSLSQAIDSKMELFDENYSEFSIYSDSLRDVLTCLLMPNSIFDRTATDEAAENAYLSVINNPIVVDKGTKIISSGDVITEHMYQNLVDLELVRSDTFDILILVRIAFYMVILSSLLVIYLKRSGINRFFDMRILYMLVVVFIIPIVASVYAKELSNMMILTLFFTTICSTYLGSRDGIILSSIEMLMMWPLYSFDSEFILVNIVGIIFCATTASKVNKSYNSAWLIIIPSIMSVATVACYNAIFSAPLASYIESGVWTGVSAILSIILAVGMMPIVELFSKVVSPVKLIELSQPSNPLLRRLFLEAPGTYTHSMMVSSLADAAADSVGADALFCRVASYFHDIGKLENPVYFTENQSDGYNPHNDLPTMDSVSIITAHTNDGVKLARKHHLPESFIKVIEEHHGTTYPGYFYSKAIKEANENNLPEPKVEDFMYKGNVPSTKESAIIMIADTCEAAIRSNKLTDSAEIEKLVRKLIKAKIDQDQLNNSGLSFDDIEKIITAFKRVYSGMNHERIQYPA
ncbi:MAG: HDIG domain-containing protein [Saccharofermentans sp.]|nr:HDIG domain-containing protein [Saccharofermentans sp.]